MFAMLRKSVRFGGLSGLVVLYVILIQGIERIPTPKSINTARQVYVASFNMMSKSSKVENGIQKARALQSSAEMQTPNSHAGAHPSH
jgi:hypothetical protein